MLWLIRYLSGEYLVLGLVHRCTERGSSERRVPPLGPCAVLYFEVRGQCFSSTIGS